MKTWVNKKKLVTNNKNTLVTHNVYKLQYLLHHPEKKIFSSVINGYSINWITTSTLNKSYKYGVVITHLKSLCQKKKNECLSKKKSSYHNVHNLKNAKSKNYTYITSNNIVEHKYKFVIINCKEDYHHLNSLYFFTSIPFKSSYKHK